MRSIRFAPATARAAAAVLCLVAASGLDAQAVISGRVTGDQGQPLGGANVYIQELGVGGATTEAGNYVLTIGDRARGQTVTLVARYIGHRPDRREIQLSQGNQTQNFTLARDPIQLDEIVVTGTADATDTRKTTFSVGTVNADQLREVPGVSALDGLTGKVAGAQVLSGTGAPGEEPSVKLRSATSLTGTQDPLIIVDGTIMRASLADISSEDIERIEVVKGAAASSLYGSDAANGVVQIFTKRGANLAEGELYFSFRNEYGRSYLPKRIPVSGAHAYQVDATGNYARADCDAPDQADCPRVPEDDGIADNAYLVNRDHQDEALRSGEFLTNYLSVGQRRENTNWNASFQNTGQEGVLSGLDGYNRRNFRMNLDQIVNDKLDFSFGAFYARSDNDETTQGPGSPFFDLTFVEPDVDLLAPNPDGSPFRAQIPDRVANAANPLYSLHNIDITTDRQRYTGYGKARYRVLEWLTAEGNFNYDSESETFKSVTPRNFLDPLGVPTDGGLQQISLQGRNWNGGATLTSLLEFGEVRNTTRAAFVVEDQELNVLDITSGAFTVVRVPEFTAADPASLVPTSGTFPVRNRNSYLVSTFDIRDRYIIDGLIRRDESSLFGSENRAATYYRASGAWRVTEDLQLGGIDELKLRISRGTAGLRPPFDAQYEAFTIVGGSPSKVRLGNRELKPAHSTETEFGFDLQALERFTAEYTYSTKVTKDQLIEVPLSASTGYLTQWRNDGTLEGKTHEIALGFLAANTADFVWRVNVAADRTRQRVTELSVSPFRTGPNVGLEATENVRMYRIAPGEKFGVMYGSRTVRSIDQLYDDPAKSALSGAGQMWSQDSVVVNEEGYVVRRDQWRTAGETPIKYVNANGESVVEIGDVNPDFSANFNTYLNYKSFAVSATMNWVQGGNIYNFTRQWPFFENRDRVYDQRSKPAEERKSQSYYNYFYNSIDPIDFFVEDGSFIKLKELAVNYSLPSSIIARLPGGRLSSAKVGIIGRNLLTFTDYSGYDPEVAGLTGDPFSFRFDGFSYPNFRTFTFVVDLGF